MPKKYVYLQLPDHPCQKVSTPKLFIRNNLQKNMDNLLVELQKIFLQKVLSLKLTAIGFSNLLFVFLFGSSIDWRW